MSHFSKSDADMASDSDRPKPEPPTEKHEAEQAGWAGLVIRRQPSADHSAKSLATVDLSEGTVRQLGECFSPLCSARLSASTSAAMAGDSALEPLSSMLGSASETDFYDFSTAVPASPAATTNASNELRFILRQARRFKTSGPAQQALEFKLNRLTLDASRDASTDDVRPGELWWWAEGDNTEGDAEAYGDSESLGPDPGELLPGIGLRTRTDDGNPNTPVLPGDVTPERRNPLSMHLMGSLWRLRGLCKKEFNGRLCRVVKVKGKVATVSLVGDNLGPNFRVNCSRLVRPDEYGREITETEEQHCARLLAQKEFDRLGRIF